MPEPSKTSAPFVGSIQTVKPEWIDYNGHLNMAFYNVLFDNCVDEAFIELGLGPEYVKKRNASFFTAEVHICYLRELQEGDPVRASVQLIDFDEKRAHFYQELHHAEEGFVSATSEQISLHVDMALRNVAPWPDDVLARLRGMRDMHQELGRPERLGRSIGLKKK
ncbi:thioesterase family protein [Rhizobiales bacterium]|uniref:thioesterase family protein n=1 Tax=Hongsoonwoonella zoysiae TaxID=2821844 RepID=UPI0015602240|nr:thioesterase family protein [Hongsoonwoonella zoysiae]NRG17859.1 thioesterase family protein [Hongsoonwoonella zoysiae]